MASHSHRNAFSEQRACFSKMPSFRLKTVWNALKPLLRSGITLNTPLPPQILAPGSLFIIHSIDFSSYSKTENLVPPWSCTQEKSNNREEKFLPELGQWETAKKYLYFFITHRNRTTSLSHQFRFPIRWDRIILCPPQNYHRLTFPLCLHRSSFKLHLMFLLLLPALTYSQPLKCVLQKLLFPPLPAFFLMGQVSSLLFGFCCKTASSLHFSTPSSNGIQRFGDRVVHSTPQ